MKYNEITCKSAINKLKRKIPYGYDLNIYRGCQHGCKYCYAIYSHKYLENKNYFEDIYVKTNVVEVLEQELSSPSWNRDIINIGGVTDSYQPAEKKYKLMPDILKTLIKYKTPCIISTKSDLVLRDYDLIDELSNITYVNIASTITCMDENIRKKIEPFGAPSKNRFDVLHKFDKTNASTGLHFMPIIPFITDTYDNIDELYSNAKTCNVDYVLNGVLYLRGQTRQVFFDFIEENFNDKYTPLLNLYKTGGASKEYKDWIYRRINPLIKQYGLSKSYTKPIKEKLK